ncbi:4-amino-4-deoxy-L-arabinose transferase [Algoriphagus faecimaris]|uniref:4-amino-4-deoxy-L-arabinose transferase n=1 Tax=Algoriphagus faecimaris TaxID=686796 RepID=A0A1G6WTD7_9BACT|nr:hypothetical protein [Algoriphagus faecimaris]SDD69074.1 4-amino-4-deoxy-L-arabinose transferase [Algoriphagus faecimaris]
MGSLKGSLGEENKGNREALTFGLFGLVFLGLYWWLGFDGITFSDDVYYMLAGKEFWTGDFQVNDHHFSSRWGAYIPAGLMGLIFGFSPQSMSLVSLLSYGLSLLLLLKILPKGNSPFILCIWFVTQVYFLHFLTKVYPDSLLVVCVSLTLFAAVIRKDQPLASGVLMSLALFFGFISKETIIFLFPLPFLLFYVDQRSKMGNWGFYRSLLLTGLALSALYLGYFWLNFGDPLYRISSINAGHYISEFTYADKGLGAILERLTITPFLTFVERNYWPWLIFALPGLVWSLKSKSGKGFEIALGFLLLLLGFWFMSSTLDFYNPIYLNPRHLIILIPPLAYLISLGWNFWNSSNSWKLVLTAALIFGLGIAGFQQDFKNAGFLLAFIPVIWLRKISLQYLLLALLLVLPGLFSVYYQKQTKGYDQFISTFTESIQTAEKEEIILVNNFVYFSKDILFPQKNQTQNWVSIEKIDSLRGYPPQQLKVMIYNYYLHAYPKEAEDVRALEKWLETEYQFTDSKKEGLVEISTYSKVPH